MKYFFAAATRGDCYGLFQLAAIRFLNALTYIFISGAAAADALAHARHVSTPPVKGTMLPYWWAHFEFIRKLSKHVPLASFAMTSVWKPCILLGQYAIELLLDFKSIERLSLLLIDTYRLILLDDATIYIYRYAYALLSRTTEALFRSLPRHATNMPLLGAWLIAAFSISGKLHP